MSARNARYALIADNDEVHRSLLAEILRLEGIESVEASNGEEALALLAQRPVDIILLDIRMPVLDGIGFLERLRELEAPPPPVFVISAVPDRRHSVAAFLGGAEEVFPKPFDVPALLSRVRAALARPRVRPAAADARHGSEGTG